MESQRVKLLTEAYLRGWLNFEYSQSLSRVREEIILSHLIDAEYFSLLQNKLFLEATLRAALAGNGQKNLFDPVYETHEQLIGLKLPSALATDTIENSPKPKSKNDRFLKKQLSEEDIAEFSKIVKELNKK